MPQDRVLEIVANNGGSISRTFLCRRVNLNQAELGTILDDLERKNKIKRTKLRNGRHKHPQELISIRAMLTQSMDYRLLLIRYEVEQRRQFVLRRSPQEYENLAIIS